MATAHLGRDGLGKERVIVRYVPRLGSVIGHIACAKRMIRDFE
jgi:hypothetical protein